MPVALVKTSGEKYEENFEKVLLKAKDNGAEVCVFGDIDTIIDKTRMPEEFLGQNLNKEIAYLIEKSGADICGENGEYHTFAFDGPLFLNKIDFIIKEKIVWDKYVILNIE